MECLKLYGHIVVTHGIFTMCIFLALAFYEIKYLQFKENYIIHNIGSVK